MRTITDVSHTARQVEVNLSDSELAARLGYTGLNVAAISIDGGLVTVHMFSTPPNAKDIVTEGPEVEFFA